jgi:hypothetical protein
MLRLQLGRKGEEIADSVGAPFLPSVPVFFFLSPFQLANGRPLFDIDPELAGDQ